MSHGAKIPVRYNRMRREQCVYCFFFSSRRRHTRLQGDWSSDVCSSDLYVTAIQELSRVDGSVGIIVAAHTSLCSNHIFLAGNESQKNKYVSKLATGEFKIGRASCRERV